MVYSLLYTYANFWGRPDCMGTDVLNPQAETWRNQALAPSLPEVTAACTFRGPPAGFASCLPSLARVFWSPSVTWILAIGQPIWPVAPAITTLCFPSSCCPI